MLEGLKRLFSRKPRDLAHMLAFDKNGEQVLEVRLGFLEYYEELHPIIDSDEYRAKRGIVRCTFTLYDSGGMLTQHAENTYSETGEYLASKNLL